MAVTLQKDDPRRRWRGRNAHRPMSEINVTPFVDVMLVLLIIFIVAAPLLTVGIPVQLPETAARPLPSEPEEPLTLSVASDGRIALQATELPREELVPRLRAVLAERSSDKIFLRGDRDARYEVIMQVMGALNNAGYRNIGLVTEGNGPKLDGDGN